MVFVVHHCSTGRVSLCRTVGGMCVCFVELWMSVSDKRRLSG